MKKTHFNYIFIALLILLSACGSTRHYSDDSFYYSTGEGDSIRFPLIKPYDVTNLEMGNGWGMELHLSPLVKEIYWYIGIHDIEKIAVRNDIIFVHTQYRPDLNEEMGEKALYWFVIIPNKNIETGFDNEGDFLKYLEKYDVKELTWEDPESIFQRFRETGCLEWIPECQ